MHTLNACQPFALCILKGDGVNCLGLLNCVTKWGVQYLSVFRRQKCLICNSVCEKRFSIACSVIDFSDADIKGALRRPPECKRVSQNDTAMHAKVRNARALSGSENKVKLSSASSRAFERSSHSNDQRHPKSNKTLFENTSGPRFC